jgi:hypothetical protein
MKIYKSQRIPTIMLIILLIIGSSLFIYSLAIPMFIDKSKYQELNEKYYQNDISKENYYVEFEKISTNKKDIMNAGSGIIIFSLIILVFLYVNKIKNLNDLNKINTKGEKTLFVLSNIIWLLNIPNSYFYYYYRGLRGDYPPFADSVNIPILQQTVLFLWCFIPLNLFLLFFLIKSKLPTKLFFNYQYRKCKKAGLFWESLFILLLIINVLFIYLFVIDGDHFSIIISMFFTYILLSLRSGKLNYYQLIK